MIIRSLAKTCLASAYTWSGASHWFSRTDPKANPFIVGYHRVVQDFGEAARRTIPAMLISSRTFEKHLDWLGRRFNLVSLDEIGLHLENDRPFKRPTAAITFDDGYADVYHNALPILKRKGIPSAVFVVTDLIDTQQPQIHDRLYACLAHTGASAFSTMTSMLTQMPQSDILDRLQELALHSRLDENHLHEFLPLTWKMIEEMERSGVTIGSHTKSHVLLTSENLESAQHQLLESKRVLESRLKHSINHLAYPDGRFNRPVLEAVQKAGYRFAYTICGTRDEKFPLFTISRKILWEKACENVLGRFSAAVMNCQTAGIFDGNGACTHIH